MCRKVMYWIEPISFRIWNGNSSILPYTTPLFVYCFKWWLKLEKLIGATRVMYTIWFQSKKLTCQAGTDIIETHEHLCHAKSIKVLWFYAIDKVAYMQSEYTKLYIFLATIQGKKSQIVKSWFLLTIHTVSYRTTFKSMFI
jgi:hypothetical protein